MSTEATKLEKLFNDLVTSIFTTEPVYDYEELADKFVELSTLIHEDYVGEEAIWYLGENGHCDLGALIIGAYWHYTEWHGGQDSDGYAALSTLGTIFSPGISCIEEDTREHDCYTQLDQLASAAKEKV